MNAIGDVVDPETGKILAGALNEERTGFADLSSLIRSGVGLGQGSGVYENTVIAVVAANVDWTQAQATKAAQMAHDGMARAIRPVHMPFDGDTVFALGTGGFEVDAQKLGYIGAVAADALAAAVVAAILHAEGIDGVPARRDIVKNKP